MATKIFIFGDSIAYGICDEEGGGWVSRLRKYIDSNIATEKDDFEVFNLGICADNSENIINRLEFETYQRTIHYKSRNVFLIAIGINDACFLKSNSDNAISAKEFKENLQYIICLAKKFSENVFFIGLTKVNEEKNCPSTWNKNEFYKNEYIKQYNETIKKVCEEQKLNFIDVLTEFQKENYKELLDEDGLHPNPKGHQKIFEIVKEALKKNNII